MYDSRHIGLHCTECVSEALGLAAAAASNNALQHLRYDTG